MRLRKLQERGEARGGIDATGPPDFLLALGAEFDGAAIFLVDYFVRHSPASFLLFAASDGTLALLTLLALFRN